MNAEKSLLTATKQTKKADTYPGYPTARLVMETLDNLTLPEGPWTATVNTLPSSEEQERLRDQGYELDDLGRPLHPWLREMLTDPEVGVVTGLGEYWHWGPNKTADPVVINNDTIPKILLIERKDTGAWALPGGFIDDKESAETAALRELQEEAGLLLLGGSATEIYTGIVADLRTTAHAWAETTALLWKVEGMPTVTAGDDACRARWFTTDNLPDQLHGSHAVLIEQALERAHEQQLASHTIHLPRRIETIQHVDGGHMTYHHLHAKTTIGQNLFIKSHDTTAFSDPIREAHSRKYLAKEFAMYQHINQYNQQLTPQDVQLEDGRTLIMNALDAENGWYWSSPESNRDKYIQDALSCADTLQLLPIPEEFHDTLLPTYDTHIAEGWPTLTNNEYAGIENIFSQWRGSIRPEFREHIPALLASLPDLKKCFDDLPKIQTFVLTHHDYRQANIAWHPEYGARIVDWSWTGVGRVNSDATTFLIDLHKSGVDTSRYLAHFNRDHALTLIGFWLAHSLWPTRDGDTTVRFHQAVSALSAFDLLRATEKMEM